jgi:hypothetical protein
MAKGWSIVLLMMMLTACTTAPQPTPTPPVLHPIATTPDLEVMLMAWLSAYVEDTGMVQLQLEVLSPQILYSSLDSGEVETAFSSQEPPQGWFATPMAREAIAIIVNPQIPVETFGIDELADIFSGRLRSWDAFADIDDEILPVIPFQGDAVRERFAAIVLGEAPFDPSCLLGSNPHAILDLVGERSGAIGFIPMGQVGEGVRVVAVEGEQPDYDGLTSGRYPLWFEVIATSPQEPTGPVRDFLGWLQGSYLPEIGSGFAD